MKRYAIVLAAGKGTRMQSDLPKVGHLVCGKPMVQYVVDELVEIGIEAIYLVVGHGAEQVKDLVTGPVTFVTQASQLGTGHAVQQVTAHLANQKGTTLVLTGDTPLLQGQTIRSLLEHHEKTSTKGTVLTTIQPNPKGYGRIISDENQQLMAYGRVQENRQQRVYAIIEEKDASPSVQTINEVNTGIFCFDNETLFQHIGRLGNQNAQQEYYVTDMVQVFLDADLAFQKYSVPEHQEFLGINDRVQLAQAEEVMRARINRVHMLNGVTLVDPKSTWIEKGVVMGRNTTIYPNVFIGKGTKVGENTVIESGSVILNTKIEENCLIQGVRLEDDWVGSNEIVRHVPPTRTQSVVITAGEPNES